MLDWVDIILHIVIAIALTVVAMFLQVNLIVIFAIALFWPLREAFQVWKKDVDSWWNPLTWSKQKLIEGFAPVGAVFVTYNLVWYFALVGFLLEAGSGF